MVSILLTIGGTVMNALAFSNTNFCSSKLVDHGGKECKRFHLVLENLQMARDGCNEDRMKQLDSINKKLHQKNEVRTYINNIDETMLEYYRVFLKQI